MNVEILSNKGIVIALLALAAFIGFRHGLRSQLFVLLGVWVGSLLANLVGPGLIERLNRLYKAARFLIASLTNDEAEEVIWGRVQALPNPLHPTDDVGLVSIAVLLLVIAMGYWVGIRRHRFAGGLPQRVMGAAVGVASGYLAIRQVTRLMGQPVAEMGLSRAMGGSPPLERDVLPFVLVIGVTLIIFLGLRSSTRSGIGRPPTE